MAEVKDILNDVHDFIINYVHHSRSVDAMQDLIKILKKVEDGKQ